MQHCRTPSESLRRSWQLTNSGCNKAAEHCGLHRGTTRLLISLPHDGAQIPAHRPGHGLARPPALRFRPLGMGMSAATGNLVSESKTGKQAFVDPQPYRVTRFA